MLNSIGGYVSYKNVAWWDEEDPIRAGQMLSSIVKQIRDRYKWRYDACVLHASQYAGNANAGGVTMTPMGDYHYNPRTKPRNITRMAIDTYMSSVAKLRPLPKVQTSMGNWAQQKRAKKATQWVEGAFHMTRFVEKFDMPWKRDSAIFSQGGVVKLVRKGKNRIAAERVLPWEYLEDEWDARYGDPRNCYQITTVDLGRALAIWGKKLSDDETDEDVEARVKALKAAATSNPKDDWTWEGECDTTVVRVRLVWGYHICDDIDAHADDEDHECNGSCDLAILGGHRIMRLPFTWDEFPFQKLQYSDPIAGGIGMSLAEMLEGWQEAADVRYDIVDECLRAIGGTSFLVDNNADIPNAKFVNGGVRIIRKRPGSTVTALSPPPAHPMVVQAEQSAPAEALSEFGFSQMATQGSKPAGLDSGEAIRAYEDVNDTRRLPQAHNIEQAYAGLARKMLLLARDIADAEGEVEVLVPMAKGLLPLKWSEVQLDDFQVRVMPSSWLPQHPAARLEVLNYLLDRQVITVEEFRRLFGGPDYEWELDLQTAEHLNIDEKLEAIYDAENEKELRFAEQQAIPNNYQDPVWMMMRAQQRYSQGQNEGLPPQNQQALRRIMSQCKTLIERQKPPPPNEIPGAEPMADPMMADPALAAGGPMPPPGAPPMGPMGGPMPPQAPGVM